MRPFVDANYQPGICMLTVAITGIILISRWWILSQDLCVPWQRLLPGIHSPARGVTRAVADPVRDVVLRLCDALQL